MDGGRRRGRPGMVALSVVTMVTVLGAVAIAASLLPGDPSGTNAGDDQSPEPTAGTSTSISTSASAGPIRRPETVPAGPWRLLRVGDSATMTTEFTDPGTNDTHRCDIAWDDGATSSGPAQGHVCRGTHRYTRAGVYTVASTVTDDDGGVGRAPGVLVIVYDPAAGAVRGSGRLKPAGDGAFHFTASYPQPSATGPDGSVTFALPAKTGVNLRNHQHLDWLVATADGKIAIKGTAERGSGDEVGFVLYGYHGCRAGQADRCQPGPDRLRMVVWDATAHGPVPEGVPVLYDNRPGAPFALDRADPQPIAQGGILT